MANKILKTIILGAPGSGKGTISSRLVKDFGLLHVSSGDLLRSQVTLETKDGLEACAYMKKGQLVPDDLITKMVIAELAKVQHSWLLDGFPRTAAQAEALSHHEKIDLVLNLHVPFATIRQRLENRWIHLQSGRVYHAEWNPPKIPGIDDVTGDKLVQRDDDKPETVTARLRAYEELTTPVLKFYKDHGLLKTFEGTESNVIYPKMRIFMKEFLTSKAG